MIPASTAAAAPMRNEPRLVEKRFWAISTTRASSLLGHDWDAVAEARGVARDRAPSAVQPVDVLDEVSGDRPFVRDRVVGMIGNARRCTRRTVVPCDVEGSEVGDRDRA